MKFSLSQAFRVENANEVSLCRPAVTLTILTSYGNMISRRFTLLTPFSWISDVAARDPPPPSSRILNSLIVPPIWGLEFDPDYYSIATRNTLSVVRDILTDPSTTAQNAAAWGSARAERHPDMDRWCSPSSPNLRIWRWWILINSRCAVWKCSRRRDNLPKSR